MILLDDYTSESQITGFYFKSENCISNDYLVRVVVKERQVNCLVVIYKLEDVPQSNGELLIIKNGSEIKTDNLDYVCQIDLWSKYFLPKFKEGSYQWYYDYNKTGKENEIQGLADVMKFAMELGLEKAEIKCN